MKKVLKILGALVVLLLAVLILIPVIFKDDIVKLVKTETNNAINAEVEFGDFSLSLIKDFPNFYFSIEDVSVTGINEFEGLKLAEIGELDLSVDLMSVINGESIQVNHIWLKNSKVHAKVLESGQANWDIAKESEEGEEVMEEVSEEGSASFKLELKALEIDNFSLRYEDATFPLDLFMEELNLSLSGDMTEAITNLDASGGIKAFTLDFDGIQYFKQIPIQLKALVEANIEEFKFTFKENEVIVGQLPLALDGWLAMPNDPIDMDLNFAALKTDFKDILALVPAAFASNLDGVETSGKLALNGHAKGRFLDTIYPAFGLDLSIDDARFNYPDLPKSVEDIQVKLSVQNPDGDLDKTIVDLSKFHLAIAGNPVDLGFYLANPISDPDVKASVLGKLDLGSIQDVVPLEKGDELNGKINADLKIAGRLSTLEQERYDEFQAMGKLMVEGLHYKSDSLDYPVDVQSLSMSFTPKYVQLENANLLLGRSDLAAQGKLENFIAYALKDNQTLSGTLNVQSKLLDINELAGIDPNAIEEENSEDTEETSIESEEEMEVVLIPKYIDFVCLAKVDKLIFDNMEIASIEGGIAIKNETLTLNKTRMELLDGSMIMSGYYSTIDPKVPSYDFAMNVSDFDVKQTVNTFNTVETLAPIAKNCEGKYNANLTIKGDMDEKMEPIFESIFGKGVIATKDVLVRDYEPLMKIGKAIKYEKLNPFSVSDANISFTITAGSVFVEPFTQKIGNSSVTIAGSTSLNQTMDYTFSFAIPREEFGGQANAAVDGLLAQAASKGVDIKLSDVINIDVRMTGDVSDPKISTDFKKSKSNATDAVKDRAKEELDKQKEALEAKAKEELDKQKKEAEEAAKKALEEQKKKAQEELEKQKQDAKKKLEDEAKKKLKGLFGK